MGTDTFNITETMIQMITEKAIEIYRKVEKQEEKAKRDRRLYNVKELMRNYKRISESVKAHEIADSESDITIEELMTSTVMLESLKQSRVRSRLMVDHVAKTLAVYKLTCDLESSPYRYQILVDRHVHNLNIETIMDKFAMSKKTVYRNLNQSYEDLTVLLFGIDAVKFETE